MRRKVVRKLILSRETLRVLGRSDLLRIYGGTERTTQMCFQESECHCETVEACGGNTGTITSAICAYGGNPCG
jgi:hypothetical protein